VINLALPYGLQYGQLDGIRSLQLPWRETVTRGVGRVWFWTYITVLGAIVLFGYSIYALLCKYRDSRKTADKSMLLAVCLFLLISSLGIFGEF
jgi:hypothetical protein